MSKKGGYVIVDLKGQSITAGTPFTLDGVTARLDRAKNKACLLSGFAIGNDEKRDVFVDLQPTADGYAGTIDGYKITIEDDEVTFETNSSFKLYLHSLKTNFGDFKVYSSRKTAYTFNDLKNDILNDKLLYGQFVTQANGSRHPFNYAFTDPGGAVKFYLDYSKESSYTLSSMTSDIVTDF